MKKSKKKNNINNTNNNNNNYKNKKYIFVLYLCIYTYYFINKFFLGLFL